MKIGFETWVDENIKYENDKILFREAVSCYKVNANRAALLLSYLAFINVIKRRLTQANKPTEVTIIDFTKLKNSLDNEDVAEQKVFECMNSGCSKYFDIKDSLRNQIVYWKNKRNDCAHLKQSTVNEALVESFWIFLIDNLVKFQVKGSSEELLSRIRDYFDEDKTRVNSPCDPLIDDIKTTVEIADFDSFLSELLKIYEDVRLRNINKLFDITDSTKIFYELLKKCEDPYCEKVKTVIKGNEKFQSVFLGFHVDALSYFTDDPTFIREFWKKSTYLKIDTIRVLLSNNLIPKDDINDFTKDCVDKIITGSIDEYTFVCLKGPEFEKRIENRIKTAINNDWNKDWVQKQKYFIQDYIKYKIESDDKDFIKKIIKETNNTTNNYNLIATYIDDICKADIKYLDYITAIN